MSPGRVLFVFLHKGIGWSSGSRRNGQATPCSALWVNNMSEPSWKLGRQFGQHRTFASLAARSAACLGLRSQRGQGRGSWLTCEVAEWGLLAVLASNETLEFGVATLIRAITSVADFWPHQLQCLLGCLSGTRDSLFTIAPKPFSTPRYRNGILPICKN